MTKKQTIVLFQKLYEPCARSYSNWVSLLMSLLAEDDITKLQFKSLRLRFKEAKQ